MPTFSDLSSEDQLWLRKQRVWFNYTPRFRNDPPLVLPPADRLFVDARVFDWCVCGDVLVPFVEGLVSVVVVTGSNPQNEHVFRRFSSHREAVQGSAIAAAARNPMIAGVVLFNDYYAGFSFPPSGELRDYVLFDPAVATWEWWLGLMRGSQIVRSF